MKIKLWGLFFLIIFTSSFFSNVALATNNEPIITSMLKMFIPKSEMIIAMTPILGILLILIILLIMIRKKSKIDTKVGESVLSISVYLVLFGVGAGLFDLIEIISQYTSPIDKNTAYLIPSWILVIHSLLLGIDFVASCTFIYAGISLKSYLHKGNANLTLKIILFKASVVLVSWLVALAINKAFNSTYKFDEHTGPILFILFTTWYLYTRIKRLVKMNSEK